MLRRSIIELCVADHRGDPVILQRWLSNKTPGIIASWISAPGSSLLLAVRASRVLAVGRVSDAGHIALNYVSPDARFGGVSRALLGAMEERAADRGSTVCTLLSTLTARRLYRSAGYIETGPPAGAFGTASGYPPSSG